MDNQTKVTEKVIAMAEEDTAKVTKLSKNEEAILQSALQGLVTKVAAKFGLPAILVAAVTAGLGSYFGKGDTATKSDVEAVKKSVEEGFNSAAAERTTIKVQLNTMEKDNIRRDLELKALKDAFDEYKRTHP